MTKEKPNKIIVCQNRKARFDYEIIETLECGIVLTGTEIKSVRLKHVSLDESFAMIQGNQLYLINCNIEPYRQGNIHNHVAKRERKLLLHRSEISNFAGKAKLKGFTLVPLSMYILNSRAKVEIAVCRGKQTHDKRQTIKERDAKRQIKEYN
jgi:SsrA-binding protein